MSLTKDRNTPHRNGDLVSHPVAASVRIFAGALVVLNTAGYATPGNTATGLTAVGRAEKHIDNRNGDAGDAHVTVRRGVFQYANDSSITRTHIGSTCYVVDDQTVAASDGESSRSVAGTVIDLDADGVWVEIG